MRVWALFEFDVVVAQKTLSFLDQMDNRKRMQVGGWGRGAGWRGLEGTRGCLGGGEGRPWSKRGVRCAAEKGQEEKWQGPGGSREEGKARCMKARW